MSLLILPPDKAIISPIAPVSLNKANPLSKNIIQAWICNGYVGGKPTIVGSSRFTENGKSLVGGGSNYVSGASQTALLTGRGAGGTVYTAEHTVVVIAKDVGNGYIADDQSTGTDGATFTITSGNAVANWSLGNFTGPSVPTKGLAVIAFYSGMLNVSLPFIYVNGRVTTAANYSLIDNWTSPRYAVFFGSSAYPTANPFTGRALGFYLYKGKVTESHLNALRENPFRIWLSPTPKKRFIYFDVAASGGGLDLAGDAVAQTTATGQLTQQLALSGASIATATAAGVLNQALDLSGSAAAITTASGDATLTIALTGDALAQAIATASFSDSSIDLSGAASAQASTSGNVNLSIALSGAAVAQALAIADLNTVGAGGLSGLATAQASASGSLGLVMPLLGNATATTTASGNLTTVAPLSGASVSVANASGNVNVSVGLSSAALINAQANGSLTLKVDLSGAALAQAIAQAQLSNTGDYVIPKGRYNVIPLSDRYKVIDKTSRLAVRAA